MPYKAVTILRKRRPSWNFAICGVTCSLAASRLDMLLIYAFVYICHLTNSYSPPPSCFSLPPALPPSSHTQCNRSVYQSEMRHSPTANYWYDHKHTLIQLVHTCMHIPVHVIWYMYVSIVYNHSDCMLLQRISLSPQPAWLQSAASDPNYRPRIERFVIKHFVCASYIIHDK